MISGPPPPLAPRSERLVVQCHGEPAREVPIRAGLGWQGGGDAISLMDVFRRDLRLAPDPPRRAAGHLDGVRAVAAEIAVDESLATGRPVLVDDLSLGVELGQTPAFWPQSWMVLRRTMCEPPPRGGTADATS